MTKRSGTDGPGERPTRCGWCARALPERPADRVGRPAKYCKRSCRQRAFEARQRSRQLGLGDDELVVTRNELDDANDRLFEIGVAVRHAADQRDDGIAPAKILERLLDAIDGVVGAN